jgi:transposase
MDQQAAPADAAREVKKGQAFELRIGGANYREIARTLGISVSTAHEYVTEALGEVQNQNAETVERLRLVEKTRLEAVLVKLWTKRDQPRVADTIIRLSERISRLEGLDVGKTPNDEPPPPPPGSSLPAQINITLVAPDGTKLTGSGTIPADGETKGPAGETA